MACFAMAGCASQPARSVEHPAPDSLSYLIELPGMGGLTDIDKDFISGLMEGGVARQSEIHDWTGPNKWIAAVRAWDHNRIAAKEVAEKIAAKVRRNPSTKIVLAGWSAGSAVALWALEDLPDDVRVQLVLLIEPAVDPNHDLSRALRHVRGHLFVVETFSDLLMLGIGTIIFGVSDGGANTPAAGCVGFNRPKGFDANQYKKLVELPWKPEYARHGDYFGHNMPMNRAVAREVWAAILAGDVKEVGGGISVK
ncbi:MAG TPA: hypothetical protein VG326_15565 [Tepidisphaeraceae bacterium]|jgi:pimeloyl-ACP methyl ester carboxylesterase|nr:hypothetical protein [Tepidisphaeraceae bacterium]